MTASHLFRTFGEGCNNSVPSAIDLKSNSSDTRTLAARCKNATTSESTSAMGTDIGARPYDVRFTPKSGHQLRAVVCPLCAIRRQSAVQQKEDLFDQLVSDAK